MLNRQGNIALGAALVTVALATCAASADEVIFRGNVHTSINNATLQINALGQLVVDNLGPEGRDGVSIALGHADSIDLHIVPQPAGLPAGASERFAFRGQVSGVPNIQYGEIGFSRGTSSMAIDARFEGLGFPPRLVEVYFEGLLTGTITIPGTAPLVATVPADAWPRSVGSRRNQIPQSRPSLVCRWSQPIPIGIVGGPVFSGDELRVVAMTPSNTLDFVAQTDGTGSDVPELFIADEDTEPVCPGDLDGDGDVDVADLAILLANFGSMSGVSAADGDLDHDGDVDVGDLAILLANFGTIC